MTVRCKKLGGGTTEVPVVGQGTMGMGGYLSAEAENDRRFIDALRSGIDLGMTFIDTAEGYGGGHCEELVGRALRGVRDKVFIATKVSPENLSEQSLVRAAEKSLKRLQTDHIDLYQIHWPNPAIPICETMNALERLVAEGKVINIGVSNFSLREIRKAVGALSSTSMAAVQVEYNLFDRSIEKDILPFCEKEGLTTIAYSPLDQGRAGGAGDEAGELESIAAKYGKTKAQITLNWLVSHPSVIAIPKATTRRHIRENAEAADFELSDEDFSRIALLFACEPVAIPVDRIRVSREGEGNRRVYQTVSDAVENALKFVPSPVELAQSLTEGDFLKPVRLIPTTDPSGRYHYDLIEGRVRYWAWVIAHNGKASIPALIRPGK